MLYPVLSGEDMIVCGAEQRRSTVEDMIGKLSRVIPKESARREVTRMESDPNRLADYSYLIHWLLLLLLLEHWALDMVFLSIDSNFFVRYSGIFLEFLQWLKMGLESIECSSNLGILKTKRKSKRILKNSFKKLNILKIQKKNFFLDNFFWKYFSKIREF